MTKDKNIPSPSLVKPEWCQYQRQYLNTCQDSKSAPSRVGFLVGDRPIQQPRGDLSMQSKGNFLMPPSERRDTWEMGGLDFLHWLR